MRRFVIMIICVAVIFGALALRFVQLANQWERCAPSHDEIVDMWKRS